MNKKDKKKSTRGTIILIVIIAICIIVGVKIIIHDFIKMNKAAKYSDKILKIYLNSSSK